MRYGIKTVSIYVHRCQKNEEFWAMVVAVELQSHRPPGGADGGNWNTTNP